MVEFDLWTCIVFIIIGIIAYLVLFFLFRAFTVFLDILPAVIIAFLVWYFTDGNMWYTIISFVAFAVLFGWLAFRRRRKIRRVR
jgi:LPXTG-motif cell wall-anchored protein